MNTCQGYEACSKSLNEILEKSKSKLKSATKDTLVKAVYEISEALVDFTSKSEPKDFSNWDEIKQIEQLDALADETRQAITAESIEGSVKSIMDSTSQLNQVVKKLKSESEKNNQKAKEIRLKPVISVVESLSSVIDELKEAKKSLSDKDVEVDIAKQIDSLVKAFQGLDKAIKNV